MSCPERNRDHDQDITAAIDNRIKITCIVVIYKSLVLSEVISFLYIEISQEQRFMLISDDNQNDFFNKCL